VWDRNAAEALPGRPRQGRRSASLRTATALSVFLLAGLALGGLGSDLRLGSSEAVGLGPGVAPVVQDGLTGAELSIQPALAPRPVDLSLPVAHAPEVSAHALALPPERRPHPRNGFPAHPELAATRAGSASPLSALNGL
jgi:hypothetical protein